MTAEQLRAARAMLRWSQNDLHEKSGVSLETIKRLEATDGKLGGRADTLQSLQAAMELAGIEFSEAAEGNGAGVRMAGDPNERLRHLVVAEVSGLANAVMEILCADDPQFMNKHPDHIAEALVKSLVPLVRHSVPRKLGRKSPPPKHTSPRDKD